MFEMSTRRQHTLYVVLDRMDTVTCTLFYLNLNCHSMMCDECQWRPSGLLWVGGVQWTSLPYQPHSTIRTESLLQLQCPYFRIVIINLKLEYFILFYISGIPLPNFFFLLTFWKKMNIFFSSKTPFWIISIALELDNQLVLLTQSAFSNKKLPDRHSKSAFEWNKKVRILW